MSSKAREALEQIEAYASSHGLWDVEVIAKTALAEPLRNCDVGTVEEQRKRFHKEYYSEHSKCKRRWSIAESALDWAQMPYEKEED